jgi:hypothetical protein
LHELGYFISDQHAGNSYDMSIYVQDAKTNSENGPERVNEGCLLQYAECLGLLGAKFVVRFSDTIDVHINQVLSASRHVVYVNVVEPLLRFLLISKGYILLHSACVGMNESGILLSALPDTGKTSLTLKCINEGFSFLSDDMTILRLPNQALCFPKPLTISWSTYKSSPDLPKNAIHNNLFFRVQSLIHSKRGRQFMHKIGNYNSMPVLTLNAVAQIVIKPPKFKIVDIIRPAILKEEIAIESLYFLQNDNYHNYQCIESVPKETSLRKAVENSDHAFLFPPLSRLFSQITIKGMSFQELIQKERDMLEGFFMNIRCRSLHGTNKSWYSMIKSDLFRHPAN